MPHPVLITQTNCCYTEMLRNYPKTKKNWKIKKKGLNRNNEKITEIKIDFNLFFVVYIIL